MSRAVVQYNCNLAKSKCHITDTSVKPAQNNFREANMVFGPVSQHTAISCVKWKQSQEEPEKKPFLNQH